jgi:predicted RNase H-like nuclease (RuvC/YqgF family)
MSSPPSSIRAGVDRPQPEHRARRARLAVALDPGDADDLAPVDVEGHVLDDGPGSSELGP